MICEHVSRFLRKAASPVEGVGEMRRCGTESRVEYEAVEIRPSSLSLLSDFRYCA